MELPFAAEASDRDNSGRVIVVGICGPSGSGKTTLAKALMVKSNSPWIENADDYYRPDFHLFHQPKCLHDYSAEECANSWDHKTLGEKIRKLKEEQIQRQFRRAHEGKEIQDIYIFVEGFKIFAEKELVSVCDRLIWLEPDLETCFQRAATERPDHPRPCTRAEYCFHRWAAHEDWRTTMLENARGHPSELTTLANGNGVEEEALVEQAWEALQAAGRSEASLEVTDA